MAGRVEEYTCLALSQFLSLLSVCEVYLTVPSQSHSLINILQSFPVTKLQSTLISYDNLYIANSAFVQYVVQNTASVFLLSVHNIVISNA